MHTLTFPVEQNICWYSNDEAISEIDEKKNMNAIREFILQIFILYHDSHRTLSSPHKMCSFISSHQKTGLIDTP